MEKKIKVNHRFWTLQLPNFSTEVLEVFTGILLALIKTLIVQLRATCLVQTAPQNFWAPPPPPPLQLGTAVNHGFISRHFYIYQEHREIIFWAIYQVHIVKRAKSMELQSHNHKFFTIFFLFIFFLKLMRTMPRFDDYTNFNKVL